jgi:hypothetical protein
MSWQRYTPRRQPAGSGWAWQRLRAHILERDNFTCRYCGGVATQVDHIVGVAAGGTDDDSNLVSACATCNEKRRVTQAATSRKREPERHPGDRLSLSFCRPERTGHPRLLRPNIIRVAIDFWAPPRPDSLAIQPDPVYGFPGVFKIDGETKWLSTGA